LAKGGLTLGGVLFAIFIGLATLGCIWSLVWAAKY
jgi:hypothetical protein